MNPTGPKCPKCGEHTRIICHGKRYALYPSGCLMIVGLPIAVLHQASCPTDYECQSCGMKFGVRSSLAKLCLGIILVLGLWLIGAFVFALI